MKKYVLMVLTLIATMMLFVGCGNKTTKVNIKPYLSINLDGYSGYGTATYEFDQVAFETDYMAKIDWSKEVKKYMKEGNNVEVAIMTQYDAPIEFVEIEPTLSKTEGISNGDEITLSWPDFDGGYTNAKIKAGSITIKAEGLKEPDAMLADNFLAVIQKEYDDRMTTELVDYYLNYIRRAYGIDNYIWANTREDAVEKMQAHGLPQAYIDNCIQERGGWFGGYYFDQKCLTRYTSHECKLVNAYIYFSKTSSDVSVALVYEDTVTDEYASTTRYNTVTCNSFTVNDDGSVFIDKEYLNMNLKYYEDLTSLYNDYVNAYKADYEIVEKEF